jgi:glucosamine-6-phosphate deaminase
MKFIIVEDYDTMSREAAELVADQIKKIPGSILGLATGSTPLGLYKYLTKKYSEGLDFSNITTFNLDEYYGLPSSHPQSYRYYMDFNLFNHVNINKNSIHIPCGICPDIEEECKKYDRNIAASGGIDLQILGIGRNGHIGFNEPEDALKIATHITYLSEDTINANSRFFESKEMVPKAAVTMGLGTIMKAKKILLLASGKDKSEAIFRLSQPVVDTSLPASVLQLHNNVIVIADRDAASLLDIESTNGIAI